MYSYEEKSLDFDIRKTALEAAVRLNLEQDTESSAVLRDAAAYEAFLRGQPDQPRIERDAA